MKKFLIFFILILLVVSIFSTTAFSQSLTKKTVYIYTNVFSKVYISGHYYGETKYKYRDKKGVIWYYYKTSLKIGNYPIKLTAEGYKDLYDKIKVTTTGSNRFYFRLKKESASQTPPVTTTGVGRLIIKTDVDAWVYLNNIKLGKTPLDKKIKAGSYKLDLVPLNTKYPKKTMNIKIENGRTTTLNIKFIKEVVYYEVKVITNVKAFVYINGQKQSGTTPLILKLKRGSYQLKLDPVQPFYFPYTTTINVTKNSVFQFNLQSMTSKVSFEIPLNAVLYIDDQKINFNSTDFTLDLIVGTHKIKIIYYDFVIEKEVNVKFNQSLKISLFMDFSVEQE